MERRFLKKKLQGPIDGIQTRTNSTFRLTFTALPKDLNLDLDGASAWNLLLAAEDGVLKWNPRPITRMNLSVVGSSSCSTFY